MTTEVIVANRHAVAMAADSALTVGKDRVWKTANKLFSLGPVNDIGVMMNGSGDYLGVSWEVVVKLFRSNLGDKKCATVKDCADKFFEFLRSGVFSNPEQEMASVASVFVEQIIDIKAEISYQSKVEFRSEVVRVCNDLHSRLTHNVRKHSDVTLKEFSDDWRDIIVSLAKDIFGEVITKKVGDSLVRTLHATATHCTHSEYASGIVFAGFGENELFPSMIEFVVDGSCGDLLRCWTDKVRDLNDSDSGSSYIAPFGQRDVVFSFMEGITLEAFAMLDEAIPEMLAARSEDLIKSYVPPADQIVETELQKKSNARAFQVFRESFDSFRKNSITKPVTKILGTLPKEELAEMARALVEVTSLRRRVDSRLETVGGPVDVAVISKGDGFIWLSRKNYFSIESNRDFLYRRYGGMERAQ